MTPEERTLLTQFLGDLTRTQGVAKDQEAAAMIDNAIRSNPDSGYVLVQHALLADQALHQAQDQIAQLQVQLQQAGQPQSSFLGGGLGPRMAPPAQPQGPYGQQPPPPPQPYYGSGPFSSGGGLGSFLRSAGTMAAGVAGGEMLFSGLSGLFGGHGGGFGGGFGGGGWGGGENVTINNYGDDNNDGGDGDGDDFSGGDDYS
jgi:hypothetical protein